MRQHFETRTTQRNKSCKMCGSRSWQAIKLAYDQGVRESDSGYVSGSKLARKIAPPERRSTLAVPLIWFFGVSISGMLIVPKLLQGFLGNSQISYGMFDAPIYIPSLVIGFFTFLIHSAAAAHHNATKWARSYLHWQRQRICRSCGHVSPAPHAGGSQ